ncbi:Cyclin-C [Fasciolopsis buskii]|uniref:Cyclin-C n=1 Tax=Fasciolopsis buskii TaxID=27845 RepID=A0A8E0VE75_9TREM|nr:Cyclin-C [Fasciolopsis buski]
MFVCYYLYSLEWLLDRQDLLIHRVGDLKILGSEEEYQKVMIFFTEVIQAFGKSVEVRQQVIATATVYFKRFYSRNSLSSIDPWLMVPSCLFLASKVEEFGVLSQKNLLASCRNVVHNHYAAYFPDGYGYPYRAQDVLECEFILLEAMDCSLIVFHPYRPLVQFCEELRPQLHELADLLLERAWWIVNDSFRTDVCLHYPPYIIALGCLQTAFILLANNTDLLVGTSASASLASASSRHVYITNHPQPSVNPLAVADQWFSELNVDMEKVLEVTRHLINLYDLWRRFDEATEMPTILLKKLPRPVVPPPPHASQSYTGSANVPAGAISTTTAGGGAGAGGVGSGASQSSASLSAGGGGGGGGPGNHAAQVMTTTNSGSSGGGGASGGLSAEIQQQQQQQQQQSHHHHHPHGHPSQTVQRMGTTTSALRIQQQGQQPPATQQQQQQGTQGVVTHMSGLR